MPKSDSDLESYTLTFEKLFSITELTDVTTLRALKKLKHKLLSAAAKEEGTTRKAAGDFTFDDAVDDFGLSYNPGIRQKWDIEVLSTATTFQPSPCLLSHLENYTEIYDRSSEAACRIGLDFLLCECIAVMRGRVSGIPSTQTTEDGRGTPTPWDRVNVYCEVSFAHTIAKKRQATIVGGRVDHGVGIEITSSKSPNRLFHSLMLCIEAKFQNSIGSALAQLVVYLACLRQSRQNRGRSNTSVYGLATDGLIYRFVTITHEGVLRLSRHFDVTREADLSAVMGCLRYILETAMSMTPNSTAEKGGLEKSEELEADADDPINLDDNPYLQEDVEE